MKYHLSFLRKQESIKIITGSRIRYGMTIMILAAFLLFPIPYTLYPTFAASPLPAPTSCGTSHENAVCKIDNGLLPPTLADNTAKDEDPNIFQRLLLKINELAALLGFKPQFPGDFHARSELKNQSEVPPDLNPSGPPEEQLPGYLGKQGVYGAVLPPELHSNTIEIEQEYEKANYPPGVNPITK